jgi:hypothetical protein
MLFQLATAALAFNGPAMRQPTAARSAVSMGFEDALGAQPVSGFTPVIAPGVVRARRRCAPAPRR